MSAETTKNKPRDIEERLRQEAEARPEPLHRAAMFILREIVQNNRDARPEAERHMKALDEEYGNREAIQALETPAPAPEPEAPEAKSEADTGGNAIAHQLRQSRRFKTRS